MIFHFPFPRARARVLACVWLPLPRAMFCLERDCAAIFTAGDPRGDIVGKIRLRQFAVIDDVETAGDLALDNFRHCRAQPRVERRLVVRLAASLCQHHIAHVIRSRKGPRMSREDPIGL